MNKVILIIGLIFHGTVNLKLTTNVRNLMSARPPGKQTVSWLRMFFYENHHFSLKVVTDLLHVMIVVFQATVLDFIGLHIMRVIHPLPLILVAIFSGIWHFSLLFNMGLFNCISYTHLGIIFNWSQLFTSSSRSSLSIYFSYAFLFATFGFVGDISFVSCLRNFAFVFFLENSL